MFDLWENGLGLDASNPGDWSEDPDGDGVTNLEEARRRSHPLGAYRRMFAEGVTSTTFDTLLHVYRRGSTGQRPAASASWSRISATMAPAWPGCTLSSRGASRRYAPPPSLSPGQYAVEVESEWPIVVERITSWGGTPARGAHGTSGALPATTWFFAEGATISGFQLFYLLANPGDLDAVVDVEYLLAARTSESRRYEVPARSRRTVWVNQEGGALGAAEVSARLQSSHPIVAERTMYLAGPSGFTAGTASMGAPAASTTWLFAEGATGPLFDTFLLLANPSTDLAGVEVTFRLPDGQPITRAYAVAPRSRRTIWVDQEDLRLLDTSFSTHVASNVPDRRRAGHVVGKRLVTRLGRGALRTRRHGRGRDWVVAEMPESAFLLIANAGRPAGPRAGDVLHRSWRGRREPRLLPAGPWPCDGLADAGQPATASRALPRGDRRHLGRWRPADRAHGRAIGVRRPVPRRHVVPRPRQSHKDQTGTAAVTAPCRPASGASSRRRPTCISRAYSTVSPTKVSRTFILKGVS